MDYIYIILMVLVAVNLFLYRKKLVKFQNRMLGNRTPAFSEKNREYRIIFVVVMLFLLAIFYIASCMGPVGYHLF